jgi:DNA-binding NtrC family response regulator
VAKILIADDERAICAAFSELLLLEGHTPLVAATGDEALALVEREHPRLVFLDLKMPGMSGLEVLRELNARQPELPVVLMTAYGTVDTAMEAMRLKAFDYLGKPVELKQLRQLLARALHRPQPPAESAAPAATTPAEELIGRSAAMQELFKLMSLLTGNDLTVLVCGESGAGKELVARGIHRHGPRQSRPFVAVNCAAIPETLMESELFGHEKGAFTDARDTRVGRCEAAEDGTLFLDEIAELPLAVQGKLLRVLQERSFERVGSLTPRPLRARVIAATNR